MEPYKMDYFSIKSKNTNTLGAERPVESLKS